MSEHWFRRFAGQWQFPDSYTTLDVETSGLSPEDDLICTYGFTVVRDRRPVVTHEAVLDWTLQPGLDHVALGHKLARVQQAMESRGRRFHHTLDYLQTRGMPPVQGLQLLLELVEDCERNNEVLILHNGWAFDVEFMKASFHNFLQVRYQFPPGLVYDTGIVEKASQLGEQHRPLPLPGESMEQFAWRIYAVRAPGVFWSLDQHCERKYCLCKSANISLDDTHKSGADSLLLHHLFENHRRLAGVADQIPNGGVYDNISVTEPD